MNESVKSVIRLSIRNSGEYPTTIVLGAPEHPIAERCVVTLAPGQRRIVRLGIETEIEIEEADEGGAR